MISPISFFFCTSYGSLVSKEDLENLIFSFSRLSYCLYDMIPPLDYLLVASTYISIYLVFSINSKVLDYFLHFALFLLFSFRYHNTRELKNARNCFEDKLVMFLLIFVLVIEIMSPTFR